MKTTRDYYHSPAFTAKATVLKLIPNGTGGIVILDRTIFCVQGGGQKSDVGTIAGSVVTHVEAPKETPDIIHHVVTSLDGLMEGAEVELRIDVPPRQLHSRLHTGGHLLAALVEELLPGSRACGGHHWPGEARVEFIFDGTLPDNFERALTAAVSDAIAADFSVKRTISNDGERYVQIGEHPALRCGGTHCWHLKELGSLTLRGIKQKKDHVRVGYDVSDASADNRCA